MEEPSAKKIEEPIKKMEESKKIEVPSVKKIEEPSAKKIEEPSIKKMEEVKVNGKNMQDQIEHKSGKMKSQDSKVEKNSEDFTDLPE